MPFPTYPAELEKTTLAAVEKSSKVDTDLSDDLTSLKTAFGKINGAAFEVPKKVATEKEVTDLKSSLDGEMTKVKAFAKSLADFNKVAFAKVPRLKKDKANPAAIKHVEKIVAAGTAFVKTVTGLSDEADALVKKARELLPSGDKEPAKETAKEKTEDAPAAPQADKFITQGLNALKSQNGLFALAMGSKGAWLVAGPRLAPEATAHAKIAAGGGFLRGECEWSTAKSGYVFVVKKSASGLAKKIRKAILDQTLNKLQVKVLVRGPDGKEIDADKDADTMGQVQLEDDITETETSTAPGGNGSAAPSQLWDAARTEARNKLRKLQTLLKNTNHALAAETVGLLDGVLKKIDVAVADKAGATKLTGLLNSDPDIADLEGVQLEGESFGIRAGLLKALASLAK